MSLHRRGEDETKHDEKNDNKNNNNNNNDYNNKKQQNTFVPPRSKSNTRNRILNQPRSYSHPRKSRYSKKGKHIYGRNEPVLHTIPEVSFLEGSSLQKEQTFIVANWTDILGEESPANLRHKKAVALAKVNARHVLNSWNIHHRQHQQQQQQQPHHHHHRTQSSSSASSPSSSLSSSSPTSSASSTKSNSSSSRKNRFTKPTMDHRQKPQPSSSSLSSSSSRPYIQAKDEGIQSTRGERIHFAWDSSTVVNPSSHHIPSAVNKLHQVKQRKRLQAKKKLLDGTGSKSAPNIENVRRSSSSSGRRRRKNITSSKEKSAPKGTINKSSSPEFKPKTPKQAFISEYSSKGESKETGQNHVSGEILLQASPDVTTDSDKENKLSGQHKIIPANNKTTADKNSVTVHQNIRFHATDDSFSGEPVKTTKSVSFADATPTTSTKTNAFSQSMQKTYKDIHMHNKKHDSNTQAAPNTTDALFEPQHKHKGNNSIIIQPHNNHSTTNATGDNSIKTTPDGKEILADLSHQNKTADNRSSHDALPDNYRKRNLKKISTTERKEAAAPSSKENDGNTAPSNDALPVQLSPTNHHGDVPGLKRDRTTDTSGSYPDESKVKSRLSNEKTSSSQLTNHLGTPNVNLDTPYNDLGHPNTRLQPQPQQQKQQQQPQQKQSSYFTSPSTSLNFNGDILPQPPPSPPPPPLSQLHHHHHHQQQQREGNETKKDGDGDVSAVCPAMDVSDNNGVSNVSIDEGHHLAKPVGQTSNGLTGINVTPSMVNNNHDDDDDDGGDGGNDDGKNVSGGDMSGKGTRGVTHDKTTHDSTRTFPSEYDQQKQSKRHQQHNNRQHTSKGSDKNMDKNNNKKNVYANNDNDSSSISVKTSPSHDDNKRSKIKIPNTTPATSHQMSRTTKRKNKESDHKPFTKPSSNPISNRTNSCITTTVCATTTNTTTTTTTATATTTTTTAATTAITKATILKHRDTKVIQPRATTDRLDSDSMSVSKSIYLPGNDDEFYGNDDNNEDNEERKLVDGSTSTHRSHRQGRNGVTIRDDRLDHMTNHLPPSLSVVAVSNGEKMRRVGNSDDNGDDDDGDDNGDSGNGVKTPVDEIAVPTTALVSSSHPATSDNGIETSGSVNGVKGIQSRAAVVEKDIRYGGGSWNGNGEDVQTKNDITVYQKGDSVRHVDKLFSGNPGLLFNNGRMNSQSADVGSGVSGNDDVESEIGVIGCDDNGQNKAQNHATKGRELETTTTTTNTNSPTKKLQNKAGLGGVIGIDTARGDDDKGDNYHYIGRDRFVSDYSWQREEDIGRSDSRSEVCHGSDRSGVFPAVESNYGFDSCGQNGERNKVRYREKADDDDILHNSLRLMSIQESDNNNARGKKSQRNEFISEVSSSNSIMNHETPTRGDLLTGFDDPVSMHGESFGATKGVNNNISVRNQNKSDNDDDDSSVIKGASKVYTGHSESDKGVLVANGDRGKAGADYFNGVNYGQTVSVDQRGFIGKGKDDDEATSMVRRETLDNLTLESNFKDAPGTVSPKVKGHDNPQDVIYTKPVMFRPRTAGMSNYADDKVFGNHGDDDDADLNNDELFSVDDGDRFLASYLTGGGGGADDPRWNNDGNVDDDIKFINTDADYYEVFGYNDETRKILEATKVYPLDNSAKHQNRRTIRRSKPKVGQNISGPFDSSLSNSNKSLWSTNEGRNENYKGKIMNESRVVNNSKKLVPKLTLNISPERNPETGQIRDIQEKNNSKKRDGQVNLSNEEKETKSKLEVKEMVARCESDDSIYRNSHHPRVLQGKTVVPKGARKLPHNKSLLKKDSSSNIITASPSSSSFNNNSNAPKNFSSSLSSSSSKLTADASTHSKYNPEKNNFVSDYKKAKIPSRNRKFSYEPVREEVIVDTKVNDAVLADGGKDRNDLDTGTSVHPPIAYKSFTQSKRRIRSEADIDTTNVLQQENVTHAKTGQNKNRVVGPGISSGINFSQRKFTGSTGNAMGGIFHQPQPPSFKDTPTALEVSSHEDHNTSVDKIARQRADTKRGRPGEEKNNLNKTHSDSGLGEQYVFMHRSDVRKRHARHTSITSQPPPDAIEEKAERVKNKFGFHDGDSDEDTNANMRLSQSFNGRGTKSILNQNNGNNNNNIPLSLSLPKQNKLFKEEDTILSKATAVMRPSNKTILTPLVTGKEKEASRVGHAQVAGPLPPPVAKPRKLKPIIHHSSAQKQRHGVTSGL